MSEIRPARSQDVAFMVPLVAESSGGIWPAVWRALARDGESTEAAGERAVIPHPAIRVGGSVLLMVRAV